MKNLMMISAAMLLSSNIAVASMADKMISEFQQQGLQANAQAGEALWNRTYIDSKSGQQRSCTSCHGDDLKKTGEHAKTGKLIEPMALTVNAKRLTERKKINKWFKRNCKWTLGRECTSQEKADVLVFLKNT